MKRITYNASHGTYELGIEFCKYGNGQNAIELVDMEDGCPFMTASVSIGVELEVNEVAIKNYSENEGILDILIKNDIVSKPHKYVKSGFVEIPICKIV